MPGLGAKCLYAQIEEIRNPHVCFDHNHEGSLNLFPIILYVYGFFICLEYPLFIEKVIQHHEYGCNNSLTD